MNNKFKLLEKYKIDIIFFVFYILYCSIILKTPYLGDDKINSFVPGVKYSENANILKFTINIINSWIHNEGRFFPFSFYMYGLFDILPNLFSYKLLILVVTYFDLALLGVLVYKISKSKLMKYWAMIFTVLSFQFYTTYHNGLIAFHMLMQSKRQRIDA